MTRPGGGEALAGQRVFCRGSLRLLLLARGALWTCHSLQLIFVFGLLEPSSIPDSSLEAGRAGLWSQTLRGGCSLYCRVGAGRQDSSSVPVFGWWFFPAAETGFTWCFRLSGCFSLGRLTASLPVARRRTVEAKLRAPVGHCSLALLVGAPLGCVGPWGAPSFVRASRCMLEHIRSTWRSP